MSLSRPSVKILTKDDQKAEDLTHKIINKEEKLPKLKRIWTLLRYTINNNFAPKLFNIAFQSNCKDVVLCWKFLCISNKLLHYGGSNCKIETIRRKDDFKALFSAWENHSANVYPISDYTRLFIMKLNVLIKYPSLSGSFYANMTTIIKEKNTLDLVQDLIAFLVDITNFLSLVIDRVGSTDVTYGHQYSKASMLMLFALITIIEDAAAVYNLLTELFLSLTADCKVSKIDTLRQQFSILHEQLKQLFCLAAGMDFFRNYLKVPEIRELKITDFHESSGHRQPAGIMVEEISIDRTSEYTLSDSEDDLLSIDDHDLLVEPLQPIVVTDPNSLTGRQAPQPATAAIQQAFMSPAGVASSPSQAECAKELIEVRQKLEKLTKELDEQNNKVSLQKNDLKRLADLYTQLRNEHDFTLHKGADLEKQLMALEKEKKIEVDRLTAIIDQQKVELANQEVMKQSIETLSHFKALHDEQSVHVDQLEKSIHTTICTIQEAGSKFKVLLELFATTEMPAKSSKQLKVDKSILEKCSYILTAVTRLVFAAKKLQAEMKDVPSTKAQYRQSYRWKNGLLSAAESVKLCAILMVDIADGIMSAAKNDTAKLIAVAQEVSASTAQLLSASWNKVHNSASTKEFHAAIREVNSATSDLTDTVMSAISLQTEEDDNLAQLTLSHAKREQFDIQARIATLEVQLAQERRKLAELRNLHYRSDAEFETVAPANNETAALAD